MKHLSISVMIILMGFCANVSSQAPDLTSMDIVTKSIPDGPVARVGKTSIEKIDFILLYQSELREFMERNPDKELTDGNRVRIALLSINILLEQELLYQEALAKKLTVDQKEVTLRSNAQIERLKKGFSKQAGREVTDAEIAERLGYKNRGEIDAEIERAMLVSEMRDLIVSESAAALPEETILAVYEKNKAEMVMPMQLHVKHISIRARKSDNAERKAGLAKANKALDSLYGGQLFDSVAKEYTDPDWGSDMGLVPIAGLPPFMVEAAVPMQVGDISDILESETGVHIIQLVAKVEGGAVPQDEALEIIRRRLAQDQRRLVVREYCDKLILGGAPVRVFLELEENLARISDKPIHEIE